MRRTPILLATAAFALSLAGFADAAPCKDAKGKFTKCPPAAAAPAAMASAAAKAGGPNCKKGKRCGNACISMKDVCHK
jgi:hypothetical protein